MNIKAIYFFLLLMVALLSFRGKDHITIFCAGDSTMANKDISAGSLERGWGMYLKDFFSENVIIKNFAQNGRSTKTFRSEGWWTKILNELENGDYVVIQFGHNDDMTEKESYTTPLEYENNLIKMISEVEGKKGIPILCTPVVRRKFDKEGNLVNTHKYLDIVQSVAKRKKVVFVDMESVTRKWLSGLGNERTKRFFMNFAADYSARYPSGSQDDTHFREEGAKKVASLFIDELKRNESHLLDHLKEDVRKQ